MQVLDSTQTPGIAQNEGKPSQALPSTACRPHPHTCPQSYPQIDWTTGTSRKTQALPKIRASATFLKPPETHAMPITRRHALLSALVLPSGCALHYLRPLTTEPLPAPSEPASMRPAAVGQHWTYRQYNQFNSALLATVQEKVVQAGETVRLERSTADGQTLPEEGHQTWGHLVRDPVWDLPLNFEQPTALWPTPLATGAQTAVRTHYVLDGGSFRYAIECRIQVLGWQRVALPMGSFDTVVVERRLRLSHPDLTRLETRRRDRMWIAPDIGRWVARETSGEYDLAGGKGHLLDTGHEDRFRWELVDFR